MLLLTNLCSAILIYFFNLTANNNQSEFVLDYIMANSKASFRVGEFKEDKDYCYDFMINLKNTDKLPELIKQIENVFTHV